MLSPSWIKGIVGLSLVVTVATTAATSFPKKLNYKGLNEEEIYKLILKKCGDNRVRERENEAWHKCFDEMWNEWKKVNNLENPRSN